MRILDMDTDQPCRHILIMLTPEEAKELSGSLDDLVEDPQHDGHSHISDAEYQREIIVAIYTKENLGQFSPDVQRLIESDE